VHLGNVVVKMSIYVWKKKNTVEIVKRIKGIMNGLNINAIKPKHKNTKYRMEE